MNTPMTAAQTPELNNEIDHLEKCIEGCYVEVFNLQDALTDLLRPEPAVPASAAGSTEPRPAFSPMSEKVQYLTDRVTQITSRIRTTRRNLAVGPMPDESVKW